MPAPKQLIRQHDFSAGELHESAKRGDDDPIVRSGLRQAKNWRIDGRRKLENRPGRTGLFLEEGRTDEVRMSSSGIYHFSFGDGTLKIRDTTGNIIAAQGDYLWTPATADQIVWESFGNDVYMCFPGQVPKIARWDGAISWTFLDYAVMVTSGSDHKHTPFYRFATRGVTMAPATFTGTPLVNFSANVLTAGMVGSRFRYQGRQLTMTSFVTAQQGGFAINERLLGGQRLDFGADVSAKFAIGDIVVNGQGTAKGIVSSTVTTGMDVTLLSVIVFAASDAIFGPTGAHSVNTVAALSAPPGSVVWDEEIFNAFRGYPRSVFVDQNRLGFCDFPALPEAIVWSAYGAPEDLQPGASPTDAIMELAPKRSRVFHVAPGNDEFVLSDRGIYYIPISESNPLKPGSVSFRQISSAGASQIQPITLTEGTLFVDAAKTGLKVIEATGQQTRPYIVREVSDRHSHLIKTPRALAVAIDGPFAEPYAFVLNTDGTLAVGKFDAGKEWVGWLPWDTGGAGVIEWISSASSNVLLTTRYGGATTRLIEKITTTALLDGQMTINAIPVALARIPGTVGANIGNMTAGGGLANGFNEKVGTTLLGSPARSAANGFIGKNYTTPQKISFAYVFPTRDEGFCKGGSGDVTIELRGKQTAFNADGSDGTLLGSFVGADVLTGLKTITSSDVATAWAHVCVRISRASAPTDVTLAEVQFFNPTTTRVLWPHISSTITLMDGARILGPRAVDAYGVITADPGEDLTVATLIAGLPWTAIFEPFLPHIGEGQSVGQTLDNREVRGAIAVQQSTGFLIQSLKKLPKDETETWLDEARIAAYLAGENQEVAPPKRERSEPFKAMGSDPDPRIAAHKDTPGTLRIIEFSAEAG